MATLMDGVVIPQDAVISGHVEQSVAKTADAPSLLKIKFESARWKKGSAPVTLSGRLLLSYRVSVTNQ